MNILVHHPFTLTIVAAQNGKQWPFSFAALTSGKLFYVDACEVVMHVYSFVYDMEAHEAAIIQRGM